MKLLHVPQGYKILWTTGKLQQLVFVSVYLGNCSVYLILKFDTSEEIRLLRVGCCRNKSDICCMIVNFTKEYKGLWVCDITDLTHNAMLSPWNIYFSYISTTFKENMKLILWFSPVKRKMVPPFLWNAYLIQWLITFGNYLCLTMAFKKRFVRYVTCFSLYFILKSCRDLSGNPISAIEPKAFLYLNRLPDLWVWASARKIRHSCCAGRIFTQISVHAYS